MINAADVIDFWFADSWENNDAVPSRMALWFKPNPQFDNEITTRFGDEIIHAVEGRYAYWMHEAKSALALIILLDQFPRNVYRGTADAFEYDPQALNVCLQVIKQSLDLQLPLAGRLFAYMPLQHAEDKKIQDKSVKIYERLLVDYRNGYADLLEKVLRYAQEHNKIIKQFGRFPHRNALLDRQSTEAELNYLREGGQTFGQGS